MKVLKLQPAFENQFSPKIFRTKSGLKINNFVLQLKRQQI